MAYVLSNPENSYFPITKKILARPKGDVFVLDDLTSFDVASTLETSRIIDTFSIGQASEPMQLIINMKDAKAIVSGAKQAKNRKVIDFIDQRLVKINKFSLEQAAL